MCYWRSRKENWKGILGKLTTFNFILWPYFISIPDTKWNNITGRRRTTQQLQTHTQRETMPCLNLSTNVPLDGVDTSSILSEATSTVANLIGKPEAVCSLSLSTGSVTYIFTCFWFIFLNFRFRVFMLWLILFSSCNFLYVIILCNFIRADCSSTSWFCLWNGWN